MDHDCSKVAIFIPCNKVISAEGVAGLYLRYVFPRYGLPLKVISDRDPCHGHVVLFGFLS
jgi:hypothetical protein